MWATPGTRELCNPIAVQTLHLTHLSHRRYSSTVAVVKKLHNDFDQHSGDELMASLRSRERLGSFHLDAVSPIFIILSAPWLGHTMHSEVLGYVAKGWKTSTMCLLAFGAN